MYIDVAKYSFNGGHQINEDSVCCGNNFFVVADGLGGHSDGEVASAAAVNYIQNNYVGDISDEGITSIIKGANNAVCELANGSHTTIAAAFLNDDKMRIANVGDSRVYIFRHNMVYMVTKDHSVCQAAVDMGEMSFEDIRFSDDRSRLLKVLGTDTNLVLKNNYKPVELCDGDAFLICSDGFWENVHEREMEADLLKAETADSWARFMLKRHILNAHNEGDNYSVICGIVHSERKAPPLTPKVKESNSSAAYFPSTVEMASQSKAELNAIIDSVNNSNSNTAAADTAVKNAKEKNMLPFILGAVAIAVVAIALIVILAIGGNSSDNEEEMTEQEITSYSDEVTVPYESTTTGIIVENPDDTSDAPSSETTDISTDEIPGIPIIQSTTDTSDETTDEPSDVTSIDPTIETTDETTDESPVVSSDEPLDDLTDETTEAPQFIVAPVEV